MACVLCQFRSEDVDVAGVKLVAGRAWASTTGGFCRTGCDPVEVGRERFRIVDIPDCFRNHDGLRPRHARCRDHPYLASRPDVGRYQEAHGLFLGRPHGFRDHGNLCC